jgi:hypothetical protein
MLVICYARVVERLREGQRRNEKDVSARNGLTTVDQHIDVITELKARADDVLR